MRTWKVMKAVRKGTVAKGKCDKWDEWVEDKFQSPSYWLYSDEDSMTITVQILEKTLEQ